MSVWQFSREWLSQFVPGSVFSHSAQLLSGCGHVQQACDPGGGGGAGGGDGGWYRHHAYLPFFSQFSGERLSQSLRGCHTSHSAQLLTGCGHVQHEPIGGGNGGDGGGAGGGEGWNAHHEYSVFVSQFSGDAASQFSRGA